MATTSISWLHPIITTFIILTIATEHKAVTLTEVLKANSAAKSERLVTLIRIPRDARVYSDASTPSDFSSSKRQARESNKYYPAPSTYKDDPRSDRTLKGDDDQAIKDQGKRCINCDSRGTYYGGTGYDRGRGSYDRYYDAYSPYGGGSSSRGRYDPYSSRNDRDRYVDDYDRDMYRGRNRYSQYEGYDPRERYYSGYDRGYDRGLGYDNRGYEYDGGTKERGGYYDPYYRNRYDPYEDDYYTRGGYDSGYASRGYGGRPDYYGGAAGGSAGYARGYSYGGDRDRYGGYGGYSGGGYGYGGNGYASSGYSGSRSRYPAYDYDNGYRSTSYLYDRPSSTTADPPKNTDDDRSDTSSTSQNGSN